MLKNTTDVFLVIYIYIYIYIHTHTHTHTHTHVCMCMHIHMLLFSCSVVSNSLQPHGWQHARLPCPSLFPQICSNSCPLIGIVVQPSHPLSSHSPPSFNLSQHQDLSNELTLCFRWPKYQSFSISPSNEHSGLISFKIDWFDLLAVQGTLKNLLQHHSLKASVLQCSAFFIIHLSHPYMTTGKITALTIWTFVSKVMSLLFNMLSRFVIAFL